MSISPDTLLDRILLKRRLSKWRALAVFALLLAFVSVSGKLSGWEYLQKPHIARVVIDEMIVDDPELTNQLRLMEDDKSVKAVIIHIDSPGGTVVGGEQLYKSIKDLSDKKPTVTVMRTMATSAAYMGAIGAERVYAMEGTITGSIGVILQSVEVTELVKKLGLKPVTIKSSPLKATPSPFETMTPEVEAAAKVVVNDFYNFFVDVVIDARKFEKEEALKLADGRIFTGRQALELNLIDEIGGEKEALIWLNDEKGIDKNLEIEQVKFRGSDMGWANSIANFFGVYSGKQHGLLSIWKP